MFSGNLHFTDDMLTRQLREIGICYGMPKSGVDCDRIEEELGSKTTVVATGGLAKKIVPHCRREIILDEDLLLKGLRIIYEKNR